VIHPECKIETLHEVAGRVANVDDWHREMLAMADQAEAAGDSFAVQNLAEAANKEFLRYLVVPGKRPNGV